MLVLSLVWMALGAGPEGASLEVEPPRVLLTGSDASAQVLVSIRDRNGRLTDVSRRATYTSLNPQVAEVSPDGLVRPRGDGQTEVIIRDGETEAKVSVEVRDFANIRPVGFRTQVMPIFTRYGCNSGGCHGKAAGQNGFKLSLLGFDPRADYEALVFEARGRRVFPGDPPQSLLLKKPTASVPHGGGRRFEPGSPEYRTIERWVRSGMPFEVKDEPVLESLSVSPSKRVLGPETTQQLRAVALYSDGSEVDVTRLAQYQSNAPDLATADDLGKVKTLDAVGEAAVMVRFGGLVSVARVTIPRVGEPVAWTEPSSENLIDPLVFRKLRELNIPLSPPCTDAEFARRSSLDICGILPDPDDVVEFETDTDPQKRAKWVDRLLARPEYADYFAMKWSAILRNQRGRFGNVNEPVTFAFHGWVRQAVSENRPYDQFASQLVAAKGDPAHNPAVAWYRSRNFNNENTEKIVEDTAQLFLGMRIQCARCHHHPFEKWSQDDYYGFSSFFARIGRKNSDDPFTPRIFTLPEGRATLPGKGTSYAPKALDGPEFPDLGPRDDPRDKLAEWLRQPDNPFFARALVNRYWKHFFGRGLVEPEDDIRVSNPPTNPALLDALADDFIHSGYDLKHLVRLIATSQTYARSSLPLPENALDHQNFARFYARRLPAEVLLDTIGVLTGTPEHFNGLPASFRATQLPDESYNSPFLDVFGRPERESVCECERSSEANLAQRLELLNSPQIQAKLSSDTSRAARYADTRQDPRPDSEKVEELYRLAFSRSPLQEEKAVCLGHLSDARAKGDVRKGYEDLIWVLINSKEFLFNK